MEIITVPFDYDEKLYPRVVPICICDTDEKGNTVHRGWIEFRVAPIADRLRQLSYRLLGDVYHVSEVAESVVHAASRKRGSDLGTNPELLIYKSAEWRALDLKAGGRRARTGSDVELFVETIDQLAAKFDLEADREIQDLLEKLVATAIELGMTEAAAMVEMILRGCSAEEFIRRFGKRRNTLTQMFFRHMRKAAHVAGLSL
jgi:DNA-directed RNA polymerase specialized sigma24 family protein